MCTPTRTPAHTHTAPQHGPLVFLDDDPFADQTCLQDVLLKPYSRQEPGAVHRLHEFLKTFLWCVFSSLSFFRAMEIILLEHMEATSQGPNVGQTSLPFFSHECHHAALFFFSAAQCPSHIAHASHSTSLHIHTHTAPHLARWTQILSSSRSHTRSLRTHTDTHTHITPHPGARHTHASRRSWSRSRRSRAPQKRSCRTRAW